MIQSSERLFEANLNEPIQFASSWGEALVFSQCHPAREPNQDSCLCLDFGAEGLLLAVADGMGGHRQGEVASRMTLEAVEEKVQTALLEDRGMRAGVIDGFEGAQERVSALGSGAGTTLVVATIDQEGMRSFHTGDSMALLLGGRGLIKHQTLDHSPTAYALHAGLIEKSELLSHPDRHVLLSAIGHPGLQIDVKPAVPLAVQDTLLLASDGLTDNLTTDEIVSLTTRGSAAEAIAALAARSRACMLAADESGKADDLSLVLFRPSQAS